MLTSITGNNTLTSTATIDSVQQYDGRRISCQDYLDATQQVQVRMIQVQGNKKLPSEWCMHAAICKECMYIFLTAMLCLYPGTPPVTKNLDIAESTGHNRY